MACARQSETKINIVSQLSCAQHSKAGGPHQNTSSAGFGDLSSISGHPSPNHCISEPDHPRGPYKPLPKVSGAFGTSVSYPAHGPVESESTQLDHTHSGSSLYGCTLTSVYKRLRPNQQPATHSETALRARSKFCVDSLFSPGPASKAPTSFGAEAG